MLIEFNIQNYTCFKEKARLNMIASNYDKSTLWEENVIQVKKFNLNLLKSAVIYGANASGKTQLIKAMQFMRTFVLSSAKDKQSGEPLAERPFHFRLSTETENQPSRFEVMFIFKNELYQYGFEINQKEVAEEWLYHRPNTKMVALFYRTGQDFEVHDKLKKTKFLVESKMVRKNALLLSVAAQFNEEIAENVLNWFRSFNIISGLEENTYMGFTMQQLEKEVERAAIVEFVQSADFNIKDLKVLNVEMENLPDFLTKLLEDKLKDNKLTFKDLSVTHQKYDKNKYPIGVEEFHLGEDESEGTKKFISLSGPMLHVLKTGEHLVIDELDAKLHPNLVSKMVELFHKRNQNNAQLIFNTHNTNLMSENIFRRDQMLIIDKDRYGAASVYALSDFKTEQNDKPRKGEEYAKNYIKGKYKGIPYLENF